MSDPDSALVELAYDEGCLHCAIVKSIVDYGCERSSKNEDGIASLSLATIVHALALAYADLIHPANAEFREASDKHFREMVSKRLMLRDMHEAGTSGAQH